MNAVGNDLVWLGDPANQNRHSDRKLTGRILTIHEQALLKTSSDPDRLLWSFWAAKEAAFKVWKRLAPETVFSPSRFEVAADAVRYDGNEIPVRWWYGSQWVHAVAGYDQQTIITKVESLTGEPSQAVRALAVKTMVEEGLPVGLIEGRPPGYFVAGKDAGVCLSLSHDGPYLAVAFRVLWTTTRHR